MTLFGLTPRPDALIRNTRASKRWLRAAAGVLGVLLLGGCSILSELNLLAPSSPSATPPPSATLETIPPLSSPTHAATAPSKQDQNHLILWVPPEFDPQSGTEAGDLFHNRLDEFINAHPGLTIDVRVKAATGPGGLLDSLSTTSAAAPAAIPSLVVLSRTEMETAALKGLVYPWAGMVKTSDAADVYRYAKNLGNVQGTNYGLAFSGDALVMIFRPLQVGYAPTSWNEYLARGYPVIFPADDPQAQVMTQVLLSNAPEGQVPPEHPVVDQEELKKSYFVINEGVKNAVFPYWLADYDTFDKGYQVFLENRANYAVVWASTVINQLPENVALAPLPAINAAPFTLANGWMWVLTNPSEEKRQLIVALAETLVDPEFLAEWTEAAHLLPTSQSILKQWKNQADVSVLNDVASSARVIPSNEFTSSVGPILQQDVLGMVRGQINYLQALENSMKDLKLITPATGG